MIDTISKILCIVLIFLMLIVAPLLISYKVDDAAARREVLFDVTQFIDKVRDTRALTQGEIDQLYSDCNSHGLAVDVRIRRLIKYITPTDEAGTVKIEYLSTEDIASLGAFSKGDGVQITVKEIAVSPARSYMYGVFGAEDGPLEFTLAGIVG
ncbi:hypothetical protein FACS1894208_12390 [Clostridia bacterium]|nr:hypothetical protein FACS1894208_12390 [Clostridia bacterium]